jgi:sugar lactone lactonase YvrE
MKDTRILRFGPIAADGTAPFMAAVMDGGPTNPALFHTYAIAIAPDGSIYCSNQDSITVTRYAGLKSSTPGAPLPLPPSIESRKDIQPATFIPSAKEDKEGLKDVRGIAFGPDELLYVADRKRGEVSAYETQSGKRSHIVASTKDGLKQPIQLHFTPDGTTLFISDDGANCVWRVTLATKAVSKFIPPGAGGLNAPSALLVDGDQLLVGSREGKQILAFSLTDGTPAAKPFADKLPDNPEFFVRIRPAGK